MLVRMTFQNPIRFIEIADEEGKTSKAVAAGHPIRPAREWEVNCWLEEATPASGEGE